MQALVIGLASASAYSPAAVLPALRPVASAPRLAASPVAQASDVPAVDRAAAAAPYLLPALDGFVYGSFVYANVPPVGALRAARVAGAAETRDHRVGDHAAALEEHGRAAVDRPQPRRHRRDHELDILEGLAALAEVDAVARDL